MIAALYLAGALGIVPLLQDSSVHIVRACGEPGSCCYQPGGQPDPNCKIMDTPVTPLERALGICTWRVHTETQPMWDLCDKIFKMRDARDAEAKRQRAAVQAAQDAKDRKFIEDVVAGRVK